MNPANIRLDGDVLKTSFVFVFRRSLHQDEHIRYTHTSSEDVFKSSSRRLNQDQYICLVHTSSRRLQDVFKTSSRRVFKTSSKSLQDVFKTSCKRVYKTSSRHLQDIFKTFSRHLQDAFETFWRRLQDVLKMSWRRFCKTSWRRFEDVLKTKETQTVSRRFQDVSLSYTVLVKKFSRCPQDVFTTFLRRTAKTVIYRRICLGHTFEKFMVSVQNLQEWQQFLRF